MTEADILSLCRGWLRDYVQAAGEACHAHYAHHLQAGLAIVSAVCGHKVMVPGYGGEQRPIVWNMIVGPSQETAKSSCMQLAVDTLRAYRAETELDVLMPFGVTKRVAIPLLQSHNSRLMIVDEFSEFILEYSRDFHKGDLEWFKKLRDASPEEEQVTRKYAREAAEYPCLSFLYGVTPVDLETYLSRQHRQAGFMARIYYTYVRERERTNTELPVGIPRDTMKDLVYGLVKMARVQGTADFTNVDELWKVWNSYHPRWPECFSGLRGRWRSATLTFMVLWELAANAYLRVSEDCGHCAIEWANYGNETINSLADDLVLQPPGPKKQVLQIINDAYPAATLMATISRQTDLTWNRLKGILYTLYMEGSAYPDEKNPLAAIGRAEVGWKASRTEKLLKKEQ